MSSWNLEKENPIWDSFYYLNKSIIINTLVLGTTSQSLGWLSRELLCKKRNQFFNNAQRKRTALVKWTHNDCRTFLLRSMHIKSVPSSKSPTAMLGCCIELQDQYTFWFSGLFRHRPFSRQWGQSLALGLMRGTFCES